MQKGRSIPLMLLVALLVLISITSCTQTESAGSPTESEGGSDATSPIALTLLGTYASGFFDAAAAEIVAYDPATQRAFVVNGGAETIDILDMHDPTAPALIDQVDVTAYGGGASSVAIHHGVIAAAIPAEDKQANGSIVFFDTGGALITAIEVGAKPDMVTFTPDGAKVLSANEGEPSDDYANDPEGSITIVDISGGVKNVTQDNVTSADFTAFNHAELNPSIRIFGPGATVAQDLEPEYIAVAPDSSTAYVTLQENNALAIVDLTAGEVTDLVGLGFKDFSRNSSPGNGLDASDKDGAINIQHWPVLGMYQPDAIAAYEVNGDLYLFMANEGDSRDYGGYSEEARVKDLVLDPAVFSNAGELQQPENLGRLKASTASGDADGDGLFEEIHTFGGRSFSIWDGAGNQVYDSGDEIARITAEMFPNGFNSNSKNGSFDGRSDNQGSEPEALAIGEVDGRIYAFLGLERIGGIMVYDVSDPRAPIFVQYVNNRDFDAPSEEAGDLAPEGIAFIPAEESPTGAPLLLVANEMSGTVSVYEIGR